ncbi:putative bifunctional diguanylate cyclase/phosphodiesterase [Blastococcus deserti]|uniref:Bifunctional diguanylate cyclase/phosphodiesterase n=1 Tax=Blastococcus deserti TaxID=2259033 RepID=A0ABW4XC15_9ACTN
MRRGLPWSRLYLVVTLLALGVFATGVLARPDGDAWGVFYDLVLYNLVYLGGLGVCVQAARRGRAERVAWAGMATALVLGIAANVVYTTVIARMPDEPFPSIADAFYLAYYGGVYVMLVGLVRSRVPRFHPSMWLDGLIGALGAAAVAAAVLLGPALELTEGTMAAVVTSLAYPLADVVLLALLVAGTAIFGIRRDRALQLVGAGILITLVGDVVYLNLATQGVYVEGGPLDLTWLVGVSLTAVAAHVSRPADHRPEPGSDASSRVGWRVLAVPLACNVAALLVLAVGWGDQVSPIAGWSAVGTVLAALARTAITFREVRAFNEVRQQALTDELTGMPNRRALLEHAGRVLSGTTARRPAALLLLDLDGFKEVNDSLGHHAGDDLLRQVGPRLRGALRSGDLLARLGGDEFAVLLEEAGLDEAQDRAERLRQLLLQPFTVEGIRLHVGVSIGVATAPVPAATVQELLRCADIAMYAAKAGREGVHVYVPDPHGGTGDRLRTMEELRTALTRDDELLVHLQPQVDLTDGRVVGVEALVRWNHPTRGLLSPAQLLPAAEQAGLLRPLTDTVLELSLRAVAGWWESARVPVSVNLSAANVSDLDLPSKVALALVRYGLPAQALTLELVEDTLMGDPERGRTVLGQLRRLGVRTSIDDYGTGYSSLAYLRSLPADELKLDRSLTQDVGRDPRAAAIVRHTVALAHDLGLSLVAEGVEDAPTAAVLAELGCDVAQGYAIARPMPVDDFLTWLATPRPFLLEQARP